MVITVRGVHSCAAICAGEGNVTTLMALAMAVRLATGARTAKNVGLERLLFTEKEHEQYLNNSHVLASQPVLGKKLVCKKGRAWRETNKKSI